MRKPTWHARVPWIRLRQWYRSLRAALFTTPEPTDRPAVTVAADLKTVRRQLGRQSFAPNWEYSYRKKGEDLNLARVEHRSADVDTAVRWWQTHVRGWARDDKVVLRAHWEPEPTEHPQAHLDGVGHSLQAGMRQLRSALQTATIAFEAGDTTGGP